MDTNTTTGISPEKAKSKKRMLGNLEIASFCEQLTLIIKAGLPTYEGISILLEDAPDKETKEILTSLYTPLEAGRSFHESLKESGVFPKYVEDMIEIGELSGNLEDVLASLARYYQREESIKEGIKSAITYPLIMVGIMIAVLFVLISNVLPIFNQIYAQLGSGLSGFALTMMNFSSVLNRYFTVIAAILILLLAAAFVCSKTKVLQKMFHGRKLALNTAASRFANCMALALSSGLDTTQGMDLALQLVDNTIMQKRILHCKELMENGSSLPDSIVSSGIFSRFYASMITVGFKTGAMDRIMDNISQKYEDDVDAQINRLLAVLEPSLVIILSVVVGIILISFLLPLIGIMNSIG